MGISTDAVTTLILSGSLIGTLYAIALIVAFRWLGMWGGITVAAAALATWAALLAADPSGRYHAAAWPVQADLVVLILAVSTLPAVAVHRVRTRSGGSYLRQAVYGLGGFYLAVLGSLLLGAVLFLVDRLSGR